MLKKINTSKVDAGVITWTLCNCSEPLRVVKSLSDSIKKDGYLIDAESSRIFVPFNSIPSNVINAFLSAEDKNFFSHPGVDAKGVLRAVVNNIQNIRVLFAFIFFKSF